MRSLLSSNGDSTATDHPPLPSLSPAIRMSPPMLTQTPDAPSEMSSVATMSAARPLPSPPGSSVAPLGSRTAPLAESIRVSLRGIAH